MQEEVMYKSYFQLDVHLHQIIMYFKKNASSGHGSLI